MTENNIENNINKIEENLAEPKTKRESLIKEETPVENKTLMEEKAKQDEEKKEKELKSQDNKALIVKGLFILVLALFLLFVYSRNDAKNVKQDELTEALISSTNITDIMSPGSGRDIMQFFALDSGSYEYTIYYRNTTALAVDELLIVKANNASQLAGVDDAVSKRIDSQITAYESYGPEQVKLLENAVTVKKGNYFIYCTAKDADKYEEVLLNVIQ